MITAGGSKLEVMNLLNNLKLKIKNVVVLVDREQGGKEELSKKNLTLHSAFSLKDWIKFLYEKGMIEKGKYLEVAEYLKNK